jgi:hypothetical protein
VLPRQFEHAASALGGHSHAGRVVEVRDGVEELDTLALAVEPAQLLSERIGVETVIVQRRMPDLHLVLGEGREGADVGWAFGDDHVTWVAEHPGE